MSNLSYQITPQIDHLINQLKTNKNSLLAKGSTNYKTGKNPIETLIMYLSPYKQNSKGVNICPMANNCVFSCLNSAGRGSFSSVQLARQAKTELYINDRQTFIIKLFNELKSAYNKAVKQNKKIAIRLNGTSDLDFLAIIKNRLGVDVLELFATTIDSEKPGLILYDYTKILGKVEKYTGTKYTLTFSFDSNEDEAKKALKLGANVATVFRKGLPVNFLGFPVIDGDKTDIEMLEYKGKILGLSAKGKARKDFSGFVIDL